jgi:lipoate-protein ligase A
MADAVYFIDRPQSGTWNMALDEALLERAAVSGPAVLRFYQWREPTLSLGYFQRYDDRHSHPASQDCAVVRRASGGGAILHDRELTYSITLPAGHRLCRRADDLYRVSHRALVEALEAFGIKTQLYEPEDLSGSTTKRVEPFLCFARRTRGDVLFNQWKVAGSAQRRSRGAVLQHGSIILGQSKSAPELPGLAELTGRWIEPSGLVEVFRGRLAAYTGFDFDLASPTVEIIEGARSAEAAKFANSRWLRQR